ncbi:unnamed protein product [Discosporangium mesarthrocarpum]
MAPLFGAWIMPIISFGYWARWMPSGRSVGGATALLVFVQVATCLLVSSFTLPTASRSWVLHSRNEGPLSPSSSWFRRPTASVPISPDGEARRAQWRSRLEAERTGGVRRPLR